MNYDMSLMGLVCALTSINRVLSKPNTAFASIPNHQLLSSIFHHLSSTGICFDSQMSSRSSSMSQLPGNSNDIVPATDDKEQKLKTQKPKLRVAIPLPLMKFRKEPVLVSDPVVQKPALQIGKTSVPTLPSSQKDLELQKPPKFKLPAANKTAPQEAAAESSTSRTGKASVPTNLSVPEDLILQNPTEIKSCATDHTAPKKIIHSAKSSVETAIRGMCSI